MNVQQTITEQAILDNVNHVLDLLKEGKFIEAMQKYLHEDVTLCEVNGSPKKGKEYCISKEQELLATVTEFIRYELISGPAVKGDTSFYEAIMEFVTEDGKKNTFEQIVRTRWENGKIIDEKYYHA